MAQDSCFILDHGWSQPNNEERGTALKTCNMRPELKMFFFFSRKVKEFAGKHKQLYLKDDEVEEM